MATLYLIPNVLSEDSRDGVLPSEIKPICVQTKYFIVENVRTARRFLKKVEPSINIDELTFFLLNKRTSYKEKMDSIAPLLKGHDVGIISEAGCPGVADPGADIVELAHKNGIKVVPLVGPSSILLSLMASGLNGQNFAFIGYIPVKPYERTRTIMYLDKKVRHDKQTQIFIETPYRNNQLVNDLLSKCSASTKLCIAMDITGEKEYIVTKTMKDWKGNVPDMHKRPVIFLLG